MFRSVLLLTFASWMFGSLTEAKLCGRLPPGMIKMSRGVDITKLDMFPADTNSKSGFNRRLFIFTCNMGKTWTSPYEPVVTYDMPDQVETINALPGGILDATYTIFKDYLETKMTMSANLGVSYLLGMFSASESFKFVQGTIIKSSRLVSTVSSHISAIQVDFVPYWEQNVTGSARSFIKHRLPNTFSEATSALFYEFIDLYGTHVFDTGKFGGIIQMTTEIEESLAKEMTQAELKFNAKATFYRSLQMSGGFAFEAAVVSERYNKRSHETTNFFGGNTNLRTNSTMEEWWPTVPGNPWLISGHLEPITNLLQDEPKRHALEMAIQAYLDRAYLQELQHSLQSILVRYNIDEAYVQIPYNQTVMLLTHQAPDHYKVAELSKSVDEIFHAPAWFTKDTKLCVSGGQCDSKTDYMCATPDHMTDSLAIDLSEVEKFCLYVGINNTGASAWFTREVMLCYVWITDGQRQAQHCLYINEFRNWSIYFKDKPSLEEVSWKLRVPLNTPAWLLSTQICIRWHLLPGNEDVHCGTEGNTDGKVCAVANEWTKPYKDDRRCSVSMGLIVNHG